MVNWSYAQLVLCYLGDKSENLRRMNHLEKFDFVNRFFLYYVRILALKIGSALYSCNDR